MELSGSESRHHHIPDRTRPDGAAVVVVHGIGEQRPMCTLRTFAKILACREDECPCTASMRDRARNRMLSIPDRNDRSFELHTLVLPRAENRRQVDLYEGYWAPEIRGTRVAHLMSWSWLLLRRGPRAMPGRIRWLWWVVAGAVLLFAVQLGLCTLAAGRLTLGGMVTQGLLTIVAPFVIGSVTGTLGDAARYLDNRPENVVARHAVRQAVVNLLGDLHDSGRYQQIIVVGHSLGSVVAYDALRILWARRTADWDARGLDDVAVAAAARTMQEALDASVNARESGARKAALDSCRASFDEGRKKVLAALSRYAGEGSPPWLVSDLITVGGPIAYPELLLTPPGTTLETLIRERELPTCPPQLAVPGPDPKASAQPTLRYFSGPTWQQPGKVTLHHGAMFAATRWTNVYAAGDFIGGPVNRALGAAVIDRRLGREYGRWTRIPVFSHTRYWSAAAGCKALRHILDDAVPPGCVPRA